MSETKYISRLTTLPKSARTALGGALINGGRWADAHPLWMLSGLVALWLVVALSYSLAAPLWHDELFTFYIAKATDSRSLIRDIRDVDLNPPLSYLLTRASFRLFGTGTLQCRLPEITGFLGAMIGMFLFVKRRMGGAYAALAAGVLLAGKPAEISVQARPYGLMLGFIMFSLAAWQWSSDGDREGHRGRWANLWLCVSLMALLLTHVFGLLAWGAVAAGEIAQAIAWRRVNPGRTVALLLPLVVIILYLPLMANHGSSAYPLAFQASPNDIFEFYIGHIDRELICLWLTAAVVLFTAGRSWLRGSKGFFLNGPEWVATSALVALPLILIFKLMFSHSAFFERYGIAGSLGICILLTAFLCWWAGARPGVAVVGMCIALLISSRIPDAVKAVVDGDVFFHTEPKPVLFPMKTLEKPDLPLVDASGLTFIEMNQREPESLLSHAFYLTGRSSAIEYAHATIFEGMPSEIDAFQLQGSSERYETFISQHPHFYVFGTYEYPEDWLLRKLQADGANLRRMSDVATSYKDHELYEVTMTRGLVSERR